MKPSFNSPSHQGLKVSNTLLTSLAIHHSNTTILNIKSGCTYEFYININNEKRI